MCALHVFPCSAFYFSSSLFHLRLLSFPTRRSSDFSSRMTLARAYCFCCRSSSAMPSRNCTFCGSPASSCVRASIALRSEEHTSELQSLRHLVCRLLLEKKNTRYTSPHI